MVVVSLGTDFKWLALRLGLGILSMIYKSSWGDNNSEISSKE